MALGKAGSHYFEYAESAFKRAKLVPISIADTIKTSYEEYKQWCEKIKIWRKNKCQGI